MMNRSFFGLQREQSKVNFIGAVTNPSIAKKFLMIHRHSNIHLHSDDWKQLPIPIATHGQQRLIGKLVDEILASKRHVDPTADISDIETKLDNIIDCLYGITQSDSMEKTQ